MAYYGDYQADLASDNQGGGNYRIPDERLSMGELLIETQAKRARRINVCATSSVSATPAPIPQL